VIKGPTIMKGYWNDTEKTGDAFIEGWFRTGDMMYQGKYRLPYFVDSIPLTFSLKPKCNQLREKYQHLFSPARKD